MIGRRQFVTLLGCSAASWPLAALAQQVPVPLIGFLSSRSSAESAYLVAAFRKGLSEEGYIEGRNVAIEFRWANGRYEQLPALAADLIQQKIAVLAALGGEPSARAAKAATSAIPIVFTIGGDPIKIGLVASMNRPGGNATGVSLLAIEPEAKRLAILHELVPKGGLIAILINPNFGNFESRSRELSAAARILGRRIEYYRASTDAELGLAFGRIAQESAAGILPAGDAFFDSRRERIVAFATQSRLPTIYQFREAGLVSCFRKRPISNAEESQGSQIAELSPNFGDGRDQAAAALGNVQARPAVDLFDLRRREAA
jgi:putative ABC transport system substrate-binding protein